VHDNKKDKDTHLWPGEGSVDWGETMQLLRSAPHTPPLLLEIEGDGKTQAQVASGMTEAFRKLEQAATAGA
jgi:sugar phosphate isomerase/epimerase